MVFKAAHTVVMLLSFYWWHAEFSEIAGDEEERRRSFNSKRVSCTGAIPAQVQYAALPSGGQMSWAK
eukprot:g30091.t1